MKEVFKKSFLNGFSSVDITFTTIIIAMSITCILAFYIFLVYRVITRKTFYSKTFNISLAALAVVTAAIILTVQSSIVVSLGMVGALSIVRFRTAIKDPMDLIFLFWAIGTGIICGAGFAEIAVVLAVVLTLLILILDRLPVARAPMILVVKTNDLNAEDKIMDIVQQYAKHPHIKSQNATAKSMDMIIELRTRERGELIRNLASMENVLSASVMSHDGEVNF